MRDITLGDTIYMMFTTRQFSTGAPFLLAGTPVVSAYEDASITQITAGITLGVSHDSVTGLNLLTIVASSGNGYEAGKDYNMVITTGTVDSVSVVGEVVAQFSIQRSAAAFDLANATDGLGAIKTDTAAILVDTGTTLQAEVDGIQADTEDIQARLPAALVGGRIDASVGAMAAGTVTAAAVATGAIDADALATDAVAEIADGVWDEDATGHQTTGTFGQAIGDPVANTATIYAAVVTNAAGTDVAADIIAIKAETASILTDTAEIGAAGAGLTAIDLPDQTMNITGNITGNLSGSVGSVTGNVGGTINGLTATALADFFDTDSGTTYASAVAGSVVAEIADNAGGSALTEAGIADAVWDELQSGHVGAGSFGEVATEVAAILVDTDVIGAAGAGLTEAGGTGDQLTAVPWNAAWDAEVQSEVTDALNAYDPPTKAETDSAVLALLTAQITEAYRALGDPPTLAQFMSEVLAHLGEVAIASTTKTINKFDGTTAAETFTLDDATTPSSITRAS